MTQKVLRAKLLLDGPASRDALAVKLLECKERLDGVLKELEVKGRRIKYLEAYIRSIDGRPVPRGHQETL